MCFLKCSISRSSEQAAWLLLQLHPLRCRECAWALPAKILTSAVNGGGEREAPGLFWAYVISKSLYSVPELSSMLFTISGYGSSSNKGEAEAGDRKTTIERGSFGFFRLKERGVPFALPAWGRRQGPKSREWRAESHCRFHSGENNKTVEDVRQGFLAERGKVPSRRKRWVSTLQTGWKSVEDAWRASSTYSEGIADIHLGSRHREEGRGLSRMESEASGMERKNEEIELEKRWLLWWDEIWSNTILVYLLTVYCSCILNHSTSLVGASKA